MASHIQNGVRLHRLIDSTTDRRENFLNPLLAEELGRFKGIVSDIVIDHFIAKNFNRLFGQELAQRITRGEILRSAGNVLKKHYIELEILAIQEFSYTKQESLRKYLTEFNN